MKAIEILEEVIRQGYLPDCGTMNYDGTVTLRDWFGAVSHKGEIQYGKYFYLYADDYADVMSRMTPADVMVVTEVAGNVWLWKVED